MEYDLQKWPAPNFRSIYNATRSWAWPVPFEWAEQNLRFDAPDLSPSSEPEESRIAKDNYRQDANPTRTFLLENYEFKSLILSVKSGLTGLAQISGRRDISFEERRKLDMYYVQNWSIWLDFQIILRTVFSIITGRGAKWT